MEEYNIVDISKIYVFYVNNLIEDNESVFARSCVFKFRSTYITTNRYSLDLILLNCLSLHFTRGSVFVAEAQL